MSELPSDHTHTSHLWFLSSAPSKVSALWWLEGSDGKVIHLLRVEDLTAALSLFLCEGTKRTGSNWSKIVWYIVCLQWWPQTPYFGELYHSFIHPCFHGWLLGLISTCQVILPDTVIYKHSHGRRGEFRIMDLQDLWGHLIAPSLLGSRLVRADSGHSLWALWWPHCLRIPVPASEISKGWMGQGGSWRFLNEWMEIPFFKWTNESSTPPVF